MFLTIAISDFSQGKNKWYTVASRLHTGLFKTWKEAKWLVEGAPYHNQRAFFTQYGGKVWLDSERPQHVIEAKMHHRHVNFVGIDFYGHDVFQCACCEEFLCGNRV